MALALAGLALTGAGPAGADSSPRDPQSPETPATVAADALPVAQINGVVWSQAMVGHRVYAGGSFTSARPPGAAAGTGDVPRSNLLAYDITTGALVDGFAPVVNGQVLTVAVSPDKTRVYVGGSFTTVDGLTRKRIAAFDATTGALVSTFAPPINFDVRAIVATNTTVYAGGNFAGVGNQNRSNLAAFNAADGALLAWAPQATGGYVWSMAMNPQGTKIAVGGSFTALNGSSNPGYGLGMVDATTGANLPMAVNSIVRNGTADGAVNCLMADAEYVYGCGYTFGTVGSNFEGAFAASWDGGAVRWINDCHGDLYSLHGQANVIYAAGHTHYCENIGGMPEGNGANWKALAMGREPTGKVAWEPAPSGYANHEGQPRPSLLTWFPAINAGTYTGQSQGPWSITGNSDYIVYGGEFTRVNGQNQQGLVRFARSGLAPNSKGPTLFNTTYPIKVSSTEAGKVRITWSTNQDIDNDHLTYKVYRDDQLAAGLLQTRSVRANWWNPYGMGFTDTGVAPGSTHRYRVAVTDPFGNIANSPWTTVTVASSGAGTPYVAAVEASEPTHWWRFSEPSGTQAADTAGFRPVTTAGSPTRNVAGAIASDPTNLGIRFPGSSGTRAYTTTVDAPPDVLTLEAWFSTTSLLGGKIIGWGNSNAGSSTKMDRQVYLTNTGQVVFGVKPNANRLVVTSPATYRDGKWHHTVATLSPEGMRLYVDGALVAQRSDVVVGEHMSPGYWRIGGDALTGWPSAPLGGGYLSGTLDEVAVYERALSPAEVSAHYAAGKGTPVPNVPPDAAFTEQVTDLAVSVSSTSTDSDGTIAGYSWDWGDGTPAGAGPSATHTYAAGGTYTITLTVTDDEGGTDTATDTVTVVPANQPPIAAFGSTANFLTVQLDGSASSDADGSVVAWTWDFGDGTSSPLGPGASHTYAAPGTYAVRLTVTDDDGATHTTTTSLSVSSPTAFAVDTFERTTANSWGIADVGGAWTSSGTSTNFAVPGGRGTIRMGSPGAGPGVQLAGVSSSDTDLRVEVGSDKVATGGGTFFNLQPRLLANGDGYDADVKLLPTGGVLVILSRASGGVETTLQTSTVAGVTHAPGQLLEVRVQAIGVSPTTLRAKVWPVGQPEPAQWTASVTDTTTGLQTAGRIGVRTYLSGSATNAPVLGLFDDLWAGPTVAPGP